MLKNLLKELRKEVTFAQNKVHKHRWEQDLEKNKARLTYEKLQLIKARKPTTEVETKLKALEKGVITFPPVSSEKFQSILDSENDQSNVHNVVLFLKSQREYNELLERYNPGLRISQEDNVRKTARMVGLTVPEN